MDKIKEIRRVKCYETTDYVHDKKDFVELFVAELRDGTRYYTSIGGMVVIGTDEPIDSGTDIIDLHDFHNIVTGELIWDEEDFRHVVEEKAYIDKFSKEAYDKRMAKYKTQRP